MTWFSKLKYLAKFTDNFKAVLNGNGNSFINYKSNNPQIILPENFKVQDLLKIIDRNSREETRLPRRSAPRNDRKKLKV